MNIRNFDNCFKTADTGHVESGHLKNKERGKKDIEQQGYNPGPKDSYETNPQNKKGVVERVVDGVTGFVVNGVINPTKKAFHILKNSFSAQAMTAGTIIGGVGGGIIGHEAAKIEMANTQLSVQNWQEPVTYSKDLGNIPDSYYQPTFGIRFWLDSNRFNYDDQGKLSSASHGIDHVHRNAPVFNPDGSVRMQDVQKTVSSQRFGVVGGTIAGTALGAIGGFLGGLSLSLIYKLIKNK